MRRAAHISDSEAVSAGRNIEIQANTDTVQRVQATDAKSKVESSVHAFVDDSTMSGADQVLVTADSVSDSKNSSLLPAFFDLVTRDSLKFRSVEQLVHNTVDAHIANQSDVIADGPILVTATDNAKIETIGIASALNITGIIAGGAVQSDAEVTSSVSTYISDSRVRSVTDGLEVSATASPTIKTIAVGGAGAETFALGGSIVTNTVQNSIEARVSDGSDVDAAGQITVTANDGSRIQALAGSALEHQRPRSA